MFGFAEEDIEVIKKLMPSGYAESDLKLFLAQAKRSGLDPLSRQIYATGFKEKDHKGNYTDRIKLSVGVTIDGFRVIAERTGKYTGQDGTYWCGSDGKWEDVWLADAPPVACKVAVLRSDFTQPLWAVARFKAYNQGGPIWSRMPDLMLSKCAEMLALRKAFPNDLGGLYGKEELGQEQEEVPVSGQDVQAQTGQVAQGARETSSTPTGNARAGRKGNNQATGQVPPNGAAKQEPAKGSAPVSGASAVQEVNTQPAGKEDTAQAGNTVEATTQASTSGDTTAIETAGPNPGDARATEDDMHQLLHFAINNGSTEDEVSEWLCQTFKVTEDTIVDDLGIVLTKNQLAQAKYHFTRKKA